MYTEILLMRYQCIQTTDVLLETTATTTIYFSILPLVYEALAHVVELVWCILSVFPQTYRRRVLYGYLCRCRVYWCLLLNVLILLSSV